jgi:cell division protease FtsH
MTEDEEMTELEEADDYIIEPRPHPYGEKKINKKSRDNAIKFLGDGLRSVEGYTPHWWYRKLLAWTVRNFIASKGWKVVTIQGYSRPEPVYNDVQTDYEKSENCLFDGQYLLEKDNIRLVVSLIDSDRSGYTVQLEAGEGRCDQIRELLGEIKESFNKNNFYRGKKLFFKGDLSFIKVGKRDWDSVILDPAMKNEIRRNTIGFLKDLPKWEKYGIPAKRGIILAGEPGTGKTTVFKALMSEAENITCITTGAFGLPHDGYISDIFSIAQDLSPSMVFIEDIDFIGQERSEYYRGSASLIALLSEMDGISEKTAIVTIATSNSFETLDKALKERPSRFDRVFRIGLPTYSQRVEMVEMMSVNIPLSMDLKGYIARETNGCTPAQLQEVLHGMVISSKQMGEEPLEFTRNDVNLVVSLINFKKTGKLGFNIT